MVPFRNGEKKNVSSAMERLQRLQRLRRQNSSSEPPLPPTAAPPVRPDKVEETSNDEVIVNELGQCLLRMQAYPLQQFHGSSPLGDLLAQEPQTFALLHPSFSLDGITSFRQAAFVDTETTGLGAGAGIYCFMVGVGTFETNLGPAEQQPTHFVVRQYFMRNPAEEGALLMALSDLLREKKMLVTFNGRTFDAPLLRTRFTQNRRLLSPESKSVPLLEKTAPHLDLLHPARRLWRRRLESCRLTNLESEILGLIRSQDDVPGQLIPHIYTQYLRTGDRREIDRVFYHNREDIVSMVALATQLTRSFQPVFGLAPEEFDGQDWLTLGHSYDRAAQAAQAEVAYRHALDRLRQPSERVVAYRQLADLLKRQGRLQAAAEIWQLWLGSVTGPDSTPYVELAKYCEWQTKDLEQAEMWTAWALHNLRTAPAHRRRPGEIAALEHRLQRIQRKQQQNG